MKYFKNILAISSLFCIMFIPTFGATYGQDCHDCAIVAGLEIVDELEYYTLDDSMTVRGKTPTTEPLDIILEIIHFESGDILKTFETKSSNSRYLVDYSISDIFTKNSPIGKYQVILTYGDRTPEINSFRFDSSKPSLANDNAPEIPDWVKTNVGWWVDGTFDDDTFVSAIQYLITNGIIQIPSTESEESSVTEIPDWVKTNVGWWVDGTFDDDTFVSAIQYLITNGIIAV